MNYNYESRLASITIYVKDRVSFLQFDIEFVYFF